VSKTPSLGDMIHTIILGWLEGLRWRFQVQFDRRRPLVEPCDACKPDRKCEASR
jgi:hypothetical protein